MAVMQVRLSSCHNFRDCFRGWGRICKTELVIVSTTARTTRTPCHIPVPVFAYFELRKSGQESF